MSTLLLFSDTGGELSLEVELAGDTARLRALHAPDSSVLALPDTATILRRWLVPRDNDTQPAYTLARPRTRWRSPSGPTHHHASRVMMERSARLRRCDEGLRGTALTRTKAAIIAAACRSGNASSTGSPLACRRYLRSR
jgi:hypothetical protein